MEGAISSTPNTRIAVVTGGNKGIGLEVCRQLAGNGVTVVLTARDEARGAAAVEKLKGLGLSDVIFRQLEVTDASSIARLADFLKTRFGLLDIPVNNAASGGVEHGPIPGEEMFDGMDMFQRIEWMSKNSWENYDVGKQCLQTNYYGTKHVTEALLPLLQSSSDRRIVNVSYVGLLRFFRNEKLKQQLNDIDNLTEERLDELLAIFLKDFEAGARAVEARGWPTAPSAYKVSKAFMNAYGVLQDLGEEVPRAARQLREPWLRQDRHVHEDHELGAPDARGGCEKHCDGGASAGRRADRRVLPRGPAGGVVCVIPDTYYYF